MRNNFLKYLSTEKRYSAHTISAYETDLKQFENFVSNTFEENSIVQASPAMIRSWVVSLKDAGIGSRSINRKLTCLRSFYNFCMRRHKSTSNPATRISSLKVGKKLPVFVSGEGMEKILDTDYENLNFPLLRDHLIIEVLYQTGIRRSELLQIEEKDLDFSRSLLKITGKRNKQRYLPLQPFLEKLIRHYLDLKRKTFSAPSNRLLVNNKGMEAGPHLVYRVVNKQLKPHTSLNKTSPHVLRHTFATHLLNGGANLIAIKELLGHSNLAATQIYAHNTIEHLKRIHEQAHPKGS